jgi:hypothetical protein
MTPIRALKKKISRLKSDIKRKGKYPKNSQEVIDLKKKLKAQKRN